MSDLTREQQALGAFLLACKDQGMDGDAMQEALRALQAPAIPAGWPTEEMVAAGADALFNAPTINERLTVAEWMGTARSIVEAALAAAPPLAAAQGGWVSVDTRMPERGRFYAVMLADPHDIGWLTNIWWRARLDEDGEWSSCDPVEDGQPVTHWFDVPLPALPEQEGGK